jgi:carbon storage regulator CsrA
VSVTWQRGSSLSARRFFVLFGRANYQTDLCWGCPERFLGSPKVLQKSRGGEMQMITRRVNESLVIGGDIHVTVLDICKDRVRLAISSPETFPSYWEQTLYWDQAHQEQREELDEERETAESLLLQ